VVARDPEKAAPVMERIKALGGEGEFVSCDLSTSPIATSWWRR
jgi:hypothetical protein